MGGRRFLLRGLYRLLCRLRSLLSRLRLGGLPFLLSGLFFLFGRLGSLFGG
ncbi:hypothetical protein FACS1894109_14040 [Spirochaetia bacterium]|nr:hypothetical protein FACS1894109_14040 [Spirochaetia bacterium]